MITPLVMLALMIGPWLAVRLFGAATGRAIDARPAAAIGLGLTFLFTASGHFAQTEAMAAMLPAWVPARVPLVYVTGIVEIAIAIGFFVPGTRRLTGWIASVLLVAFFPANVHAALARVPMGGHAWGPVYLLVRGPLQLAMLLWTWWFTIRRVELPERTR
jgi:uncharacterized membrane protein